MIYLKFLRKNLSSEPISEFFNSSSDIYSELVCNILKNQNLLTPFKITGVILPKLSKIYLIFDIKP
jgi:hypothetical protein